MRILFITQYFPPEIGAPSARTSEHAKRWIADGHEVTVLTGFPNHPTGIIPPEYRGRIFQREDLGGTQVWRTWLYATRNERMVKRIVSQLSFMASAIVAATFHRARYDVVIATSPQFFVAIAGYVVSRVKRKPFVLEIRDLWPEGIVAVGLLRREALVTRILEAIELFLYRKADCIITVTAAFRKQMEQRGIDVSKIHTIRNGADLSLFSPEPRQNDFRSGLGLNEDAFLVSYIGTHGMTQGLETILEAADLLSERRDIRFLFVGDGADKPKLQESARVKGLDNVIFLDPMPKKSVPGILAASNACIVPLRRTKLFEGTIPSKIFEIMACARPIVLGVEGEACNILKEAGAGIPVEPENTQAFAAALTKLADDAELAEELGRSGARYVRENFDRSKLAAELLDAVARYVPAGRGPSASAHLAQDSSGPLPDSVTEETLP